MRRKPIDWKLQLMLPFINLLSGTKWLSIDSNMMQSSKANTPIAKRLKGNCHCNIMACVVGFDFICPTTRSREKRGDGSEYFK